jgi:hypothetical protein
VAERKIPERPDARKRRPVLAALKRPSLNDADRELPISARPRLLLVHQVEVGKQVQPEVEQADADVRGLPADRSRRIGGIHYRAGRASPNDGVVLDTLRRADVAANERGQRLVSDVLFVDERRDARLREAAGDPVQLQRARKQVYVRDRLHERRHLRPDRPRPLPSFGEPAFDRFGVLRPLRRLERFRRRVEAHLEDRAVGAPLAKQDLADDARKRGRAAPCVNSRGVAGPVFPLERVRIDLDCDVGARHLAVEGLGDLRRARLHACTHPIALGVAHLSEPPVLQRRQRQHQRAERERHPEQASSYSHFPRV